jgi:hypothetical protein
MAMKRAMVTTMRVVGNKEGNGDGDGGRRNGNGVEGGRQATVMRAMAMRAAAERQQRGRW